MFEYRRRLPHIHGEGMPIFLTWRLHGTACARDVLLTAGEAFVKAWVIMPNHVHLLLTPATPLPKITRWLKGSTAREANRILGRTGKPFWRDESFDRWIRNSDEYRRTIRYIEHNPVSAGLCASVEDWHWSSAWARAGGNACLTLIP